MSNEMYNVESFNEKKLTYNDLHLHRNFGNHWNFLGNCYQIV